MKWTEKENIIVSSAVSSLGYHIWNLCLHASWQTLRYPFFLRDALTKFAAFRANSAQNRHNYIRSQRHLTLVSTLVTVLPDLSISINIRRHLWEEKLTFCSTHQMPHLKNKILKSKRSQANILAKQFLIRLTNYRHTPPSSRQDVPLWTADDNTTQDHHGDS